MIPERIIFVSRGITIKCPPIPFSRLIILKPFLLNDYFRVLFSYDLSSVSALKFCNMTYKRAVTHFAIALAAHAKDKVSLNLNTRAGQCALWPWLCSCAHYSQHMKAVIDLPPTHSGPRNTWNKKLRLRNKYWVNMASVRTEEVYSYLLCFRIVSQEEL